MNRKFSKEEAQRIFSLAAERQQARQNEEDADQLTLADLEEAGLAAGIDPEFIRSAASDLLRPDRTTERRAFFGFPVEFRESHVFPITFDEEIWTKAVDVFSRVYDRPGRTREIGTTRRWSSEQDDNQMPAQIIAEKDENGMRITAERKMWPLTLGFGISAAVNLLVGVIFLILAMIVPDAWELVIPGSILTGIGLLLGTFGSMGLRIFSRNELKRFERVFMHLENLAAEETSSEQDLPEKNMVKNQIGGAVSMGIALDDIDENSADAPRAKSRSRS